MKTVKLTTTELLEIDGGLYPSEVYNKAKEAIKKFYDSLFFA